jgi:hypothetical protein
MKNSQSNKKFFFSQSNMGIDTGPKNFENQLGIDSMDSAGIWSPRTGGGPAGYTRLTHILSTIVKL